MKRFYLEASVTTEETALFNATLSANIKAASIEEALKVAIEDLGEGYSVYSIYEVDDEQEAE